MRLKEARRKARVVATFLLYRPRTLWVGLLLPVVLLAVFWYVGSEGTVTADERSIIVAILEVLGLFFIAKGYTELRARFGRPSLTEELLEFWKEFRSALRAPQNITITPSPARVSFRGGNARLTIKPGPDTPLDQRVKLLEQRVEDIDAELERVELDLSRETANLRRTIGDVKESTQKELNELRVLSEESAIGDAGSEVIGWVWLFLGALLSGIPG